MRYSLIVPHFNDTVRLERLIRSVPMSRDDVQVIIVDDCSPDQAALNAIQVSWPQVHWLSTPQNAGAGVARNLGLEAAKGCWVVFADSDDIFLPGSFDTFDRVLQDDDELVYFLADAVQEIDGNPSARAELINQLVIQYARDPNDDTDRQLRLQHVNPCAKVYSRALIESLGIRFDPVRRGNDVAFNVLVAIQAQKVRAEAFSVYRIYRRSGSLTSVMTATAFLERFMVLYSLAKRLDDLGVRTAIPANGQMLMSSRYGPKVMFKVWWLATRSPMYIEWLRIFDMGRWKRFLVHRARKRKERLR